MSEHSIREVAEAFGLAVSALRYYDEIGLVPSSSRRGTVRWYDRDALAQLAYVQLWHDDAQLPIADTRAIVESDGLDARLALIREQRDALRERAERMLRAADVLDHMLGCRTDKPLECAWTGGYIRSKVDAALDGTAPTDFFSAPPSAPEGWADDESENGGAEPAAR
jgi:DNA-binding transcriptional MerR regulator